MTNKTSRFVENFVLSQVVLISKFVILEKCYAGNHTTKSQDYQ